MCAHNTGKGRTEIQSDKVRWKGLGLHTSEPLRTHGHRNHRGQNSLVPSTYACSPLNADSTTPECPHYEKNHIQGANESEPTLGTPTQEVNLGQGTETHSYLVMLGCPCPLTGKHFQRKHGATIMFCGSEESVPDISADLLLLRRI